MERRADLSKVFSIFSGFKEVQKLNRHKISHSGVRAFKCQFCGKAFSLLHNMRTHEKVHAVRYFGKVL